MNYKVDEVGSIINEEERCLGYWYSRKCFLTTRWFVKTVDGYYRCPECKAVYKKLEDGSFELYQK